MLALCMALALLPTTAFAEGELSVTVDSFTTGQLATAIDAKLSSTDRNSVTTLVVSGGVLDATDWDTMQNMTGLVSVDLSGATCENNEIPTEAFNNYNGGSYTTGPKCNLTTFVFPSGVTTIQNGAFAYCKKLTFSTANWLPESVTTVNPLAFQDCSSITSVDLSHVQVLGRQAFQRSGLTGAIVLPDNLLLVSNKSVNNFYIFDGCAGITGITIGSGIKSEGTDCATPAAYLGGNLFSGTSVTNLTIPGDIEYLGSLGKIDDCTLKLENGVKYFGYLPDGTTEAEVISGTVKAVNLPNSIIKISGEALKENISVSKIEYHGTATGAGEMTLIDRGTNNLETIDLSGSGITTFSTNGGDTNGKLKTIDLSDCTALTTVKAVYWKCGGVMNLLGCTALTSVTLGSNNDGSWCKDYTLLLSSKPTGLNVTGATDKGIVLVTNGGTFQESTTFSYSSLATPTKTGYTFGGWYTDSDFSGEAATTATAGTTYYALWVNEITFDANGGSGTMGNQQIAENATTAALTANGFARTGWTFSGWNTKANGTGTAYANGAEATGIANGTTLYAQWVCAEHKDNNPRDHKCDVCGHVMSNCSGGTATCTKKAVCEICGKEYGGLSSANHSGSAVTTTWKYDTSNHWNEYSCCKAKANVAAHDFDGQTCKICGYTKQVHHRVNTTARTVDSSEMVENSQTVESPKTFDTGIAMYGVMAVTSLLGMGYVGRKKES